MSALRRWPPTRATAVSRPTSATTQAWCAPCWTPSTSAPPSPSGWGMCFSRGQSATRAGSST
eukprot:15477751-Alexandrium_andersonii.AAC.1